MLAVGKVINGMPSINPASYNTNLPVKCTHWYNTVAWMLCPHNQWLLDWIWGLSHRKKLTNCKTIHKPRDWEVQVQGRNLLLFFVKHVVRLPPIFILIYTYTFKAALCVGQKSFQQWIQRLAAVQELKVSVLSECSVLSRTSGINSTYGNTAEAERM